ncbi:MAG: head GIN domain-containing protein [Agriterribacter sp.]
MKKLLLYVCIGFLFYSCIDHESVRGNGNRVSETRSVGSFDGVELRGSMNVRVKNTPDRAVEIEGEENLLPYVETFVDDGKLVIKYKDNTNIHTTEEMLVHVSAPELEEIRITGAGDVTGEGKLESNDEIKVKVTGAGNIKLELDAPSVEADVTGSGDIQLSGNTKDIKCSTTGSGNIKATELKAENAKVSTLGSGNISVFASVKIDASISGSGDISYKGGGAVSSKVHGSGSVRAVE